MKALRVCLCLGCGLLPLAAVLSSPAYELKDERVEVRVDQNGNLTGLRNIGTGHNYAGGWPLWRLYFDRKDGEKEIEVRGAENTPKIEQTDDRIVLRYDSLKVRGYTVKISLTLTIRLDNGLVRFGSEITNNEPGTIVRELHYPLVGACRLPVGSRLLTTVAGGQLHSDPLRLIMALGNSPPYMAPAQFYRQMDLKYPGRTAANCFALVADAHGLYLASHDPTFQDTWHGLRVYPNAQGAFTELEVGLYKYPNCLKGRGWRCEANVIAPYSGSWHQTAKLYRKWADTWWRQRPIPLWVRKMKGWQRIIFTHQYGEKLFRYADLNGRIKKAGDSVAVEAVLAFAWWKSGHDNGYPDCYWVTDPAQGGDTAWKKAIADFRHSGGRLLLYFNGKLIDRDSEFYRSGKGKKICYRDNTGAEYTEQFRFKGLGTFTGHHNARTFVVADTRREEWRALLRKMADRAIVLGADSVFYDQLGYAEPATTWDLGGEFPIPNLRVIADKAETLKMLHDHLDSKGNSEFALGTEHFTDVTAQHVDSIHNITGATGPTDFTDWIRYAFPEVVLSDREIRDDTDVERRVNHAVLKGLRSDVEIYRCRDLIDKTPIYQSYLAKVNRLRDKYCDLLLLGRYRDTEGFENDNPKIQARCFVNGNRMAIVVTQSTDNTATARIRVPNHTFVEFDAVGEVKVAAAQTNVQTVQVGRNALGVLIYRKN
ncbi:MAG: DUF6259 domain-containing protein [Verrucomicrobiae bacterium]|nr:DUF6259 domain-containing protein [Verrucomicrobiae bacterium]